MPDDGRLVVVGAGTAHGVQPLDDGRSPFHFARQRLALLEPPHMHTSMLYVPTGDSCLGVGDVVDVQRPLISVHPADLETSLAMSVAPARPRVPGTMTAPTAPTRPARPSRRPVDDRPPRRARRRAPRPYRRVVMNYHGYLITLGGEPSRNFRCRFFDPWTGPLSTRFAATFVLIAGVGVTLLTRRSIRDDRAAVAPSGGR